MTAAEQSRTNFELLEGKTGHTKIVVRRLKKVKPIAISKFADKHGFDMELTEGLNGYTAHFTHYPELKDGCVLTSVYGCGRTVEEAIFDYARQISEGLLVFDAYKEQRLEVRVPALLLQ